ncbi:hypothetical protein NLG97_g9480 [Lecanicillium saksenae]|uniref:Uncharacterized protein n=1 Tax=Lecanicillium saksenae TaxID=468837 RepID=A0ACC1QJ92_9HYPO|nr:hypothetical protein NLG97_g9480 [Lecanicillium saksenae]
MICLSKADEHSLRHLSFNQSPPALSASQTTCEDLNGISNLREHVAADQDDGGGGNAGLLGADAMDERLRHASRSPEPLPKAVEAGQWLNGPLCLDSVPRARLSFSRFSRRFRRSPQRHLSSGPPSQAIYLRVGWCWQRRDYNLSLHVGALFIILFVSFTGCAFPILASKFPGLRIPARFFFVVRHFGTGVLIATAFVHLLPTAFVSLNDPCLSSFWTKDYQAMPGAIALAAVFLVTVIEMIFHPSRQIPPEEVSAGHGHQGCMANVTFIAEERGEEGRPQHPIRDMGPIKGRQSSVAQNLSQLSRSMSAAADISRDGTTDVAANKTEAATSSDEESFRPPTLSAQQQERKDRLQCILLEMGILFHSVFIGMALSVSLGNEFIILLIAISFHQTFEGLALGSRIAAVKWEKDTIQPWLMALAYGCTTPIGQAIGLATHTLYSPDSEVGLILVGVMNAISAGLLTFASLVELLSEDFLSDASWRYLRGKQRIYACLLVFLGAFGMSLVGAWA